MPYIPLSVPVREMTQGDIDAVVGAFALCTRNALAAGYDGVELHASHSYLVEEFLSPFFNKRTDGYGGSFENRMRFMFECLGAMRAGAEGRTRRGRPTDLRRATPRGAHHGRHEGRRGRGRRHAAWWISSTWTSAPTTTTST